LGYQIFYEPTTCYYWLKLRRSVYRSALLIAVVEGALLLALALPTQNVSSNPF